LQVQKKYRNHPAMQILCKALLRDTRLQLLFALLSTGGSTILVSFCFTKNIILTAFGLTTFVFGLRFFFKTVKQSSIESNRLILLLNKNPKKIIWVYALNTQLNPFGLEFMDSGVLYFKLSDGDEISVGLPAKKLKLVSKFLNRILTETTFGYSKERAEQYKSDPNSLRSSQF
jgi:hypothetical protein